MAKDEKGNKNTPTSGVDSPNKENSPKETTIHGDTAVIEKRKPGRPKKDPNAEPGDPSPWNFKAGLFLASMGAKVETVNRSVDNSRAISLVEVGDEGFLMWERDGQIAVFRDSKTCDRKATKLMALIAEMGIDL